MSKITINVDSDELKILEKRAKKNLLSVREQIEDIIRRSCVSGKGPKYSRLKPDERLISIFSREKRGNWRKKKKKN
ncbi:MAG: hypothetical protein KKF48_03625 [Nanoarchaeota archaeon]|nr:hypothetical protein [Nanoarchaeota archaeon]MBU1028109.1 hypothetical protein [Nanoarchaeota archaeon]